jgi:SAM-dependent methyltransferase
VRRDRCGACGSADLHTFLDLGSSPLADAFPVDANAAEATYPLEVAVCRRCSLAQLMEVVPDEELFGADYGFFSSASPSLVAYHAAYAAELLAAYRSQAERLTVEIACNDGDLLRHFADAGCKVYGVDPAPRPAATARAVRGLPVLTAPFGLDTAKEIVSDRGQAGLVVANNVMAHVADLDDWFSGLRELLAPGGIAAIQVQYFPDLLVGNQFDHVYHEHRFYFSLRPVVLVAMKHGLAVKSVERVPAQGGSIKMVIGHGVGYGNIAGAPGVERMCAAEEWMDAPGAYDGIQGRADYIRSRLNDLLTAEKAAGRRVAGYAASAKSTTLLNWSGIGPAQLDYVVDTTPWKVGRFTPGTHIPIVSPEQERRDGWDGTPEEILSGVPVKRADTYIALAWNYLGGIIRREREFLDGGGRFIVPIPFPMVL